jgi:uncharacterized repeat protein (TIGR03837 family)
MRWDIFCKVIDNHGDLGVCWRLARDLASRGHEVRLWLDDWQALRWMAPQVAADGRGHPGIDVLPWPSLEAPLASSVVPGDVVIEAFGCDLPDEWVARMQRPSPPRWINLEYLSAEGYVERSHGLASPVFSGPGAGLSKRFFYPGFTPRTGGLLRETGLIPALRTLQSSDAKRAQALHDLGVNWQPGQRVITLFCYQDSPVEALLSQLSLSWQHQRATLALEPDWLVLLTPGPATTQGRQAQNSGLALPGLNIQALRALPQSDFDTLLASSDLNFVRGEDSAVRALWAGRPHVWQIYRQDDGVHADKLHAFMDRWMAPWPADLRQAVTSLWVQWNALPRLSNPTAQTDLSALGALMQAPIWTAWQRASEQSCTELAAQDDLVGQLLAFVTRAG